MGLGYKREDLQANALRKLEDAKILLRAGSTSNAYYLAGYAVEMGLKACISRQIAANTIPSKEILKRVLDHGFPNLVGLAGLAGELKLQQDADPQFGANWAIVSEWSPDVRYETRDPFSAQSMVDAIDDPKTGVMSWITKFW